MAIPERSRPEILAPPRCSVRPPRAKGARGNAGIDGSGDCDNVGSQRLIGLRRVLEHFQVAWSLLRFVVIPQSSQRNVIGSPEDMRRTGSRRFIYRPNVPRSPGWICEGTDRSQEDKVSPSSFPSVTRKVTLLLLAVTHTLQNHSWVRASGLSTPATRVQDNSAFRRVSGIAMAE